MFQAPQDSLASIKKEFSKKFAVFLEVAEEQGKMFEANQKEITSTKTECAQLKIEKQKLIETIGQINKKLNLPEDAPIANTMRSINELKKVGRVMKRRFEDEVKKSERWKLAEEVVDEVVMDVVDLVDSQK